jgi:hypothetical protein
MYLNVQLLSEHYTHYRITLRLSLSQNRAISGLYLWSLWLSLGCLWATQRYTQRYTGQCKRGKRQLPSALHRASTELSLRANQSHAKAITGLSLCNPIGYPVEALRGAPRASEDALGYPLVQQGPPHPGLSSGCSTPMGGTEGR